MSLCGSLIVGVALLATGVTPVSTKSELDKLQGNWRAVSVQIEGRTFEPSELTKKGFGIALDVTGDRYHFVGIGADFTGQLKVESAGKAKRLVFTRDDGRKTASTYRWEAGQLMLAGMGQSPPGKDQKEPDVWIFKRAKP